MKNQRKSTVDILDSERLFRQLAENSADWIWMINQDGMHTYSNNRVTELLGYEINEFLARHPAEFVHPDDFICARH